MLQLNAIVLRYTSHSPLHLVLHATPQSQPLPQLEKVKCHVGTKHDCLEEQVSPGVGHPLRHWQILVLEQAPARPLAHHLDPVDGRPEVLVVPLDNAHVPPNKDELLGPLVLVGQHVAQALLHELLHGVVPLRGRLALEVLPDAVAERVVAALVGAQERGAGEEVGAADAPFRGDARNGPVVKGHEGLPEGAVLAPERRRHVHVEAVVDEDQLGAAAGQAPDEDVARVRVAVDDAPFEDLRREQVDHGGHDLGGGEAETAAAAGALPLLARGLDLLVVGPGAELSARGGHVDGRQGRLGAGGALAAAAEPARREGLLIPEPDALDPLRRQHALGREVGVDDGHVDAAPEAALRVD